MKKVRLLTQATAAVPVAAAMAVATTAFPAAAAVTQQTCSPVANKNWVHLHTTHHGSQCFGGAGITHPDYFASKICPGNNFITVDWRSPNGSYFFSTLTPGYGWYGMVGGAKAYVSGLWIHSWSRNYTC
jgi:hypothetical protein